MKIKNINSSDKLNELVSSLDYHGWLKIPDTVYFGAKDILSRSTLVKHLNCPAQLKVEDGESRQPLIEGRAFHTRLLEPEKFNQSFAISPKIDKRTKLGKKEYKDFMDSLNGRDCLSQETIDKIDKMIHVVRYDHDIADLLYSEDQYRELACLAQLEGILCKCKIDIWDNETGSIYEFKSTIADSPDNFVHSFFRYNYDIQCAFYCDLIFNSTGMPVNKYHIIGVQKAAPFQVYKLTAGDSVLQLGRARYEKLLRIHRECIDQDYWPSSMQAFELFEAPNYLLNKHT